MRRIEERTVTADGQFRGAWKTATTLNAEDAAWVLNGATEADIRWMVREYNTNARSRGLKAGTEYLCYRSVEVK